MSEGFQQAEALARQIRQDALERSRLAPKPALITPVSTLPPAQGSEAQQFATGRGSSTARVVALNARLDAINKTAILENQYKDYTQKINTQMAKVGKQPDLVKQKTDLDNWYQQNKKNLALYNAKITLVGGGAGGPEYIQHPIENLKFTVKLDGKIYTFNKYEDAENFIIKSQPNPDERTKMIERLQEPQLQAIAKEEARKQNPVVQAVEFGSKIGQQAVEAKQKGENVKAGALFAIGAGTRFLSGFITGPAMLPATVDQVLKGKVTAEDLYKSATSDPLVLALNLATLGFSAAEILKGSKLLTKIKSLELPETLKSYEGPSFKYAIPLKENVSILDEIKQAGKIESRGINVFDNIPKTEFIPEKGVTPSLFESIKGLGKGETGFIDIYGNTPTTNLAPIALKGTESEIMATLKNLKNLGKADTGFINVFGETPKTELTPIPIKATNSVLLDNIKTLLKEPDRGINIFGNTPTTTLLKLQETGASKTRIISTVENALKVADGFIDVYGNIPTTEVINIGTKSEPMFVGLRNFVDEVKQVYKLNKGESLSIYGNTPQPSIIEKYIGKVSEKVEIPKFGENVKILKPTDDLLGEVKGAKITGAGGTISLLKPLMETGTVTATLPATLFVDSITKLIQYSPTGATTQIKPFVITEFKTELEQKQPTLEALDITPKLSIPQLNTQLSEFKTDLDNKSKDITIQDLTPFIDTALKETQVTDILPEQATIQDIEEMQIQEQVEIQQPKLLLQQKEIERRKQIKTNWDLPEKKEAQFKVIFTFKEKQLHEEIVKSRTFVEAFNKTWNKRGLSEIPKKVSVTKIFDVK